MKPRVVAVAFTCRPNSGSEYEVGWRWTQAAGESGNVLALTRRQCFDFLPAVQEHHPEFGTVKKLGPTLYKAVDLPGSPRLFVGRRFMRLHYALWQLIVWAWVRRHRSSFDFAHHICFVSAWLPPLVAFVGLPYIWGPVGSSAALPVWARKGVKAAAWNFVTQTFTLRNPLVRWVSRNAALVVPINRHVAGLVSAQLAAKVEVRPSVAQDPLPPDHPCAQYHPIVGATVICSTRNVPIKLPALCFASCEALARRNPALTVKVLGDAVEKIFHSTLPNLKVVGSLAQAEFFRELEQAQLLLFPTLEGSGFVALEALARGVPTVCLDGSGPADFIGGQAGLSVPVGANQASTVDALVTACEKLLCDPKLWRQSADFALKRAPLYTWSALDRLLKEEYERIGKASP